MRWAARRRPPPPTPEPPLEWQPLVVVLLLAAAALLLIVMLLRRLRSTTAAAAAKKSSQNWHVEVGVVRASDGFDVDVKIYTPARPVAACIFAHGGCFHDGMHNATGRLATRLQGQWDASEAPCLAVSVGDKPA